MCFEFLVTKICTVTEKLSCDIMNSNLREKKSRRFSLKQAMYHVFRLLACGESFLHTCANNSQRPTRSAVCKNDNYKAIKDIRSRHLSTCLIGAELNVGFCHLSATPSLTRSHPL